MKNGCGSPDCSTGLKNCFTCCAENKGEHCPFLYTSQLRQTRTLKVFQIIFIEFCIAVCMEIGIHFLGLGGGGGGGGSFFSSRHC